MIRKSLASFFILFLALSMVVSAQDENIESALDYKVNKMQKELKLTDSQALAVRPVVKGYWVKRGSILQETAGEGIVDHVAIKNTLKALKDREYQQLSKILNEDQMKKWIDKENLMAALNPDSIESSVDDGPSLNGNGVDLKF